METKNNFFKDAIGWGLLLWLFGYILGIIFFMAMPSSLIGWVITPIATLVTIWVLLKKIKSNSLQHYILIGVAWTIIAILLDYVMIVKAFNPTDGYYKIDVYLYYSLTLLLPIAVGFWKQSKKETSINERQK